LPLNDEQLEILLTINELYVESRYPGELGLLPYGKPTRKDAKAFYEFAREIYHDAMRVLESRGSQTEGEQ